MFLFLLHKLNMLFFDAANILHLQFWIPEKYFYVMFPNLCEDPFNGPLIWKYGSPKLWRINFGDEFKKWKNKSCCMFCCKHITWLNEAEKAESSPDLTNSV